MRTSLVSLCRLKGFFDRRTLPDFSTGTQVDTSVSLTRAVVEVRTLDEVTVLEACAVLVAVFVAVVVAVVRGEQLELLLFGLCGSSVFQIGALGDVLSAQRERAYG